MTLQITFQAAQAGAIPHRRSVALVNVRWFRAMARRALRDEGPQGALRAANARTAAWVVLRQAKRDALVGRLAISALRDCDL